MPALKLDDGTVITENIAIQTCIARMYPKAQLLPLEPHGEARALSLMSFFASTVHPVFGRFWRPERSSDDRSAHNSIKAKARQVFFDHLREIDTLLLGRDWFFERFSTVDAYAFVFYSWAQRVDLPVHDLVAYSAHKRCCGTARPNRLAVCCRVGAQRWERERVCSSRRIQGVAADGSNPGALCSAAGTGTA